MPLRSAFVCVFCWLMTASVSAADNVIVVTLDGFRWQELFSGADESLLDKESGGVGNVAALKQRYWRDTPEARRAALMPFFWDQVAKHGQVFGDPSRNAAARVTNGRNFSYPGYNETLTGAPDPRDGRSGPGTRRSRCRNSGPDRPPRTCCSGGSS